MKKSYKAVVDKKLSKRDKTRWVIIDIETGEVLDDAQGYGYKSPQNAYRGYAYLTRDKSKDAEKKEKEDHIRQWMRSHKGFVRALEEYAFEIYKGSWEPDSKVDVNLIKFALKQYGYEIDFTPAELLHFWLNKW
jgi:hypothetical protein